MKRIYLLLLLFNIFCLHIQAQSDCSSAQAYIVYALSHSESALEANNVTHAKHFANKAKEAFESVKAALKSCECDQVEDFVYDAIDYLSKTKNAEKLDDAYYYANKGKKLAEATIESLDICTIDTSTIESTEELSEVDELSSIESEQNQLKQQQLELAKKQIELNEKLAQKKTEELYLKKQKLILKMKQMVSKNVNTFNTAFNDCNCNAEIVNTKVNNEDLYSKSLADIRLSFIDNIQSLTSDYLQKLSVCKKSK